MKNIKKNLMTTTISKKIKGLNLIGLNYEPIFSYFEG